VNPTVGIKPVAHAPPVHRVKPFGEFAIAGRYTNINCYTIMPKKSTSIHANLQIKMLLLGCSE
jgi:hypothetical protein